MKASVLVTISDFAIHMKKCLYLSLLVLSAIPGLGLTQAAPRTDQTGDFVSLLKSILRPYLPDGYPKVELAAEIAGTSVRTLQR